MNWRKHQREFCVCVPTALSLMPQCKPLQEVERVWSVGCAVFSSSPTLQARHSFWMSSGGGVAVWVDTHSWGQGEGPSCALFALFVILLSLSFLFLSLCSVITHTLTPCPHSLDTVPTSSYPRLYRKQPVTLPRKQWTWTWHLGSYMYIPENLVTI